MTTPLDPMKRTPPGPKPVEGIARKPWAGKFLPSTLEYLQTVPNKTAALEDALRRTAAFRAWAKAQGE